MYEILGKMLLYSHCCLVHRSTYLLSTLVYIVFHLTEFRSAAVGLGEITWLSKCLLGKYKDPGSKSLGLHAMMPSWLQSLGVVTHTYNPSMGEAETEDCYESELHSESLYQKLSFFFFFKEIQQHLFMLDL